MTGQTFRENIEQEVDHLFARYQRVQDVYEAPVQDTCYDLAAVVVDWVVERFGSSTSAI